MDDLQSLSENQFHTLPVLTVGGGTSMGNYQAGFLYIYTNYLLDRSNYFRSYMTEESLKKEMSRAYRVVTGASAGAVNTFLAAMSSCRKPVVKPEQSPFYRAWIPLGLFGEHGFFNKKAVTAISILSRDPIDGAIDRILQTCWQPSPDWVEEECQVDFGISVTPVEDRPIAIGHTDSTRSPQTVSNLRIPNQTERFVLRLEKARGTDPPKIKNRRPQALDGKELEPMMNRLYPKLLEKQDGTVKMEHVMSLIKASSSFPIAFHPVLVPHEIYTDEDVPKETKSWFVDGGFFDNTPVGLAVHINKWLSKDLAEVGIKELRPAHYLTIDLGTEAWERCSKEAPQTCIDSESTELIEEDEDEEVGRPHPNLLPYAGSFLGNFFDAARRRDLLGAVEMLSEGNREYRDDTIIVAQRRAPAASAQFQNFLGFFEEDFRVFDFHLGMADAMAFIEKNHPSTLKRLRETEALTEVESPLFECVSDFAEATGGFYDFSVDPLDLSSCYSYLCGDESAEGCEEPACKDPSVIAEECTCPEKLQRWNMIALLRSALEYKRWTRTKKYKEEKGADEWFGLLEKHKYVYRQFEDNESMGAEEAKHKFREVIQDVVDEMATEQEAFKHKILVSILGKAGANYLDYLEAWITLDFGLHFDSGLEFAFGIAPLTWLRFRFAARAYQFRQAYTDNRGHLNDGISLVPLTAQAVWTPSSSTFFQVEPFVGGGVLFPVTFKNGLVALRPFVEAGLSLVLMQRVYLALSPTIYIDNCKDSTTCKNLTGEYENALSPPFHQAWGINASLGIRMWW